MVGQFLSIATRHLHVLLLCAFLAGTLAIVALAPGSPQTQDLIWWTTTALQKVRPHDAPPSSDERSVKLFAASNEFEPFQIVLRAGLRNLQNLDVTVSDLTSESGESISSNNVTIYLEAYLNLKTATLPEGDTGEWPDPLIPKKDRYAGEKRNAFPFSIPAGRNQPIWIDIYVPFGTLAATYKGKTTVTVGTLAPVSIPISLTVWNFSLPSTSSLKTAFGFNGISALKQHRGAYTNDDDVRAITYVYQKAALWHRLSIFGGTLSPPPLSGSGKNLQIDWSAYDKEVGRFLDGTAFSKGEPLFGAKATSIDLRTSGKTGSPEEKSAYWKQWGNHFAKQGWLDRLFYYVWDEPTPKDFQQIAALAKLAHSADPRIRNLVTTSLNKSLDGTIDIWTPLINCMDTKPGFPDYCSQPVPRAAYDSEIQQGKSIWWYQSCASHSCNGAGGDYFVGWPSYVIDVSATANRIFPWLAWKYEIQGELYYNMNEAFGQDADPWTDLYLHGGNGDGTLFYPGRPARIGGKTDIPIESIRLKLIREGLEDYEYLNLASKAGLGACANRIVSRLVDSTYHWQANPDELYNARKQLGSMLNVQFTTGDPKASEGQPQNPRAGSGTVTSSCPAASK